MENNGQTAHRIRRHKDALAVIALVVLLAIAPASSKAQNITLDQVTVQNPKKQPIRSEIVYFLPDNPDYVLPLEETQPTGVLKLQPPFKCLRGTKIQARPYSAAYDFSPKVFCRPTLNLKVTSVRVTVRLQENLDKALNSYAYGVALLAANELAGVETRDGKGVAGKEAANFAVVFAEKAFGVTDGVVFNRAQDKLVINSKLQAKVREYQSQNGIKETGRLDFKTVSKLAGMSAGAVRHNIYVHKPM